MSKSFAQHFQNAYGDDGLKKNYMRAHYDVTGFCQGVGLNGSVVSRLRNAVIEGINAQVLLPRAILLVFEDDILKEVNHFKPGISHICGRLLEWLSNQLHRAIVAHKEKLPSKSRKFRYPTILWVKAVKHYDFKEMNEFRDKFNNCVNATVALFREMEVLNLEKWDDCDRGLIKNDRFTARGMASYWMSINDAFEKWDREVMKASRIPSCGSGNGKTVGSICKYREDLANSNKFRWKPEETRFKLPKPKAKPTLVPYQ